MSEPAAAIPGLIRAVRASVEEHVPAVGPVGQVRLGLTFLLWNAEVMAEGVIELMHLTPAEVSRRPPQQLHAPLAENVEPRVPRRSGPDPRLPVGRPHP